MPSSPSSSRRRGERTTPTPPSPMLLASPQPLCGPRRLLSLVRSVERGEEEDRPMRQQQWGEILDLLSDLEARLARGGIAGARGCDGGDVADRSSGNKRKLPAVVGDEGEGDDVASEARLWITALTRTLSLGDQRGGSPSQKGERRTRDKQSPPGAERVYCPPAVVEAASDAITALCGHVRCHRRRAGGTSSADGPPDKRKRKKQKQRGGSTATGASTIPKEDDGDDADLVATFASRWLSSLAGHAERCLSLLDGGGGHYFGIPDYGDAAVTSAGAAGGEDVAHCAASCLRACSSLVTLLGTGLSRAGGGGGGGGSSSSAPSLPARLHGLAWAAMGSYRGRRRRPPSSDSSRRWHPRVMRAGAVLASSLPLLGCTDGDGGDGRGGDGGRRGVRRFAPPAELWSEALRSCLDALDLAVRSAWSGTPSSGPSPRTLPDADPDGWLGGIRAAVTDQGDRAAAVLCRVSALSALSTSLLDMEGYPDGGGSAAGTFHVRLPLGPALDVCGTLVGFPAGIDRFVRTAPGRNGVMTVAAEKSLLSPVGAALIADPVRCAGHDLFAAVAMAASAPSNALMGHARGVVSMVDRAMASASSNAVRRSLSTTTRRSGDARRRGPAFTRGSSAVVVRRRAMRSVKVALLALGSAAAPLLGRSALLIGGSLLETLVLGDYDGRGEGSTVGEGVELSTEAIETLSAFFAVGGSFLPLPCRATLEGVLVSGLRSIDPATASASASASAPIAAGFSATKVALLRLATDAVCSPWGDGGTGGGALTAKLCHVASALRRDRDQAVAAAAHSALCVCDALYTPRAPPLFLVGHRSGETADGSDDAASGAGMGLLDRIESARVEASEAVDREASRGRATREDGDKALVGEEKSSPGEGEVAHLPRPMNPAPASSKEGDETNAESAETHGSATRDGVSVALAEDGGNTKHAPACDGGSTTNKERAKPVEDDEENGANDAAGKSSQTDGGVGSHSSCDADRERQTTDPPPASPDAGVKHVTTSLAVAQLEADATTGIPELGTGGKFDPKLGGGEESSESGDDDFPPIVDCGPDEGDRL